MTGEVPREFSWEGLAGHTRGASRALTALLLPPLLSPPPSCSPPSHSRGPELLPTPAGRRPVLQGRTLGEAGAPASLHTHHPPKGQSHLCGGGRTRVAALHGRLHVLVISPMVAGRPEAARVSPGFRGALQRHLPGLGSLGGFSHRPTGSSREDPLCWQAGTPSAPARQRAQPGSCANSPSGHRAPPRGPRAGARAPEGAGPASAAAACGVRRPWRRGGCSGRSPTPGAP